MYIYVVDIAFCTLYRGIHMYTNLHPKFSILSKDRSSTVSRLGQFQAKYYKDDTIV